MTSWWRKGLLLVAVAVVSLLSAGCASPEDRIAESLDDWDATVIRYSWDCGAMAASLERWLEMNEDALREDVMELASETADMDPQERTELFHEITTGDRAREAEKKLAACSGNEDVIRQLNVMTDILLPIIMLDGPPEPSPPPSGEDGKGAKPVE